MGRVPVGTRPDSILFSLLLQTVRDGPLGLVHAAFRASGALILPALLLTGDLVLGGLRRRLFDLRAYASHLDHPSLWGTFLYFYELAILASGAPASQPTRPGRCP